METQLRCHCPRGTGLVLCVVLTVGGLAHAQQQATHDQAAKAGCRVTTTVTPDKPALDGIQIETADISLYEEFFQILQAPLVQEIDHPQTDKIRGYCYHGLEIVVRQDLVKPRPTGWVQINLVAADVAVIREELEKSYAASAVSKRDENERAKVIRFRLKPDVMRSNRKAIRLEVYGPEGFLIGFNQYMD